MLGIRSGFAAELLDKNFVCSYTAGKQTFLWCSDWTGRSKAIMDIQPFALAEKIIKQEDLYKNLKHYPPKVDRIFLLLSKNLPFCQIKMYY